MRCLARVTQKRCTNVPLIHYGRSGGFASQAALQRTDTIWLVFKQPLTISRGQRDLYRGAWVAQQQEMIIHWILVAK